MEPDDDTPPHRPRWIGWALVAVMALVVLGLLNLGWRMLQAAPSRAHAPAPTVNPQALPQGTAAPALAAGRTLVENADCMRCHGMDRRYVGPSLRQIAGRYQGRVDAAEYIARKIREGSVGEWGRVVMPRHPHISETQALQMAQWLLSLPPADGTDAAAGPAAR